MTILTLDTGLKTLWRHRRQCAADLAAAGLLAISIYALALLGYGSGL